MNLQNQQRLAGIIVLSVLIILLSPLLFTAKKTIKLSAEQLDVTPPKPTTTLNIPQDTEKSLPLPEIPVQKTSEISTDKRAPILGTSPIIENTSVKPASNQNFQSIEKIPAKAVLPITNRSKKVIASSTKDLFWGVQVGCFSKQTYLNRLLDQLQSNGYLVTLSKINVGSGTLTKVVVGKETSQDAAKKLAYQIEKRFKLKGNVVKYSS